MPATDAELHHRGNATLLASWEAYAAASAGAAVWRLDGVAAAVFPAEPERSVYNNALLAGDLDAVGRAGALDAMEAAYAAAGVPRFAAWVHESDRAMRADLERRGYTLDTSTRAMGMALEDLRLPRPDLDLVRLGWDDYLRVFGLPAGLLGDAGHDVLRVRAARADGEPAATAAAFDLAGDCGIYNVETVERFRRRGLATALTVGHLHDAVARGCETASTQSTPMAERVYAAAGFRDLGRFLEYVP